MIQEIFKTLNQYAVDIHTLPVNLCLSHLIQLLVECSGRPSIWDTHGISGNVFANPVYSTSSAGIESMEFSRISEPIHSSTAEKNENQTPVQDQRCQSRPSAKNSFDPNEGRFFKELWGRPTTTADFRSSFRQIPYTSNVCLLEEDSRLRYVLVHKFLRKLCIGSKKWRWLIQWMN